MKAKLIKQCEIKEQPRRKTQAKAVNSAVKTTTEVVREWIGEHQKTQQSARQAFTALFGEARMGRAT